jgi:hypothetical protein
VWWRWRLAKGTQWEAPKRTKRTKRALVRRPRATIAKTPTKVSPLAFVEMAAVVDAEPLEVVMPSSIRIRVRAGFDSPTLGRLLDVLESRR